MEGFVLFLVSFFILAAVIISIYKRVSFPRWAKWRSSTHWGINFFDRSKWLKGVLIKIAQFVVIIALLIILMFKLSIKLALKILPIKIPKL
jgi:hypothetical protein